MLNAVLYIVENGCKWGSLPKEYGDNLCPGKPLGEKGILEKAFLRLQQLGWGDLSLSAGNCGDGPQGRALLRKLGPADYPVCLLMDRAYEGDKTKALAAEPD